MRVKLTLLILGSYFSLFAQYKMMESFEEGIPAGLSATGVPLSIDDLRMKRGDHSLKWDWVGNDQLVFDTPIGYKKQVMFSGDDNGVGDSHGGSKDNPILTPPRGIFFWIYNEKASTQHIRVQFGRDDVVDCEFDYNLNFKGWRSCAVGYDRGDMRGVPREDMSRMTILAPTTGSGTFYIDMLGLSVNTNPRTVNPNPQLPEIDMHPRLVSPYPHLLMHYSQLKPTFNLEPLSKEQIADFRTIEQHANDIWLPKYEIETWKDSNMSNIINDYDKFQIVRDGNNIYGRPLIKETIITDYFSAMNLPKNERYTGCMRWRYEFGGTLWKIAKAYNLTASEENKEKLEQMFINLFDYGVDQGFDVGAGLGWIHHYSYTIREHAPAFYLMRDVLKKHNRLEKAIDICRWFYSFNKVYDEALVYNCEGRKGENADEIQGLLMPRLLVPLMMDDSSEKARDIKHYSSYYSNVVSAYSNALDETYKPDGTFFHHAGHAFGYGGRGVYGGVTAMYLLSHTSFAASDASYQRMKKITKTLLQCTFDDELTVPKAFASIRFSNYKLPIQFYQIPAILALSSDSLDTEMSNLYSDVLARTSDSRSDHDFWSDKIASQGIQTEVYDYSGFTMMPYTCVATKRHKDDWMITVRGHSKYVYPFESWGASFFAYPLFIANGYMDVSYKGNIDSATPKDKTWYDGYDWRRWAGATAVRLPYDKMLTAPGQVRDEGGEYLFSDQDFSGGVATSYGAGIYVFPFKGHDKFGLQSFTGKKTYFFYDNIVYCVGSDIHSDISEYDVETTLFQSALPKSTDPIILSEHGEVEEFPFYVKGKKKQWMIDNRGTGFYIGEMDKESELIIKKQKQTNPDYKGKRDVSGNFATAYFSHGKSPVASSYEYALLAEATEDGMKNFAERMEAKNAPIDVKQADNRAHVIRLNDISTTAYAVYHNDGQKFNFGKIKQVNKQATFMVKEEGDKLRISVSDPDLNIYDGQDDLMPNGHRVELSIYEREWFYWPSRSHYVQLTLKGKWDVAEQVKLMETAVFKGGRILSSTTKETVIEFECRDGLSAEILLQ